MKPLNTRDIFALTLVVAFHIASCKLAVTYRESSLTSLIFLTPPAITVWLHSRIGVSWATGAVMHYLTTVVWSYIYGMTYSFFYVRRQASVYYEKDSVGLEHPPSFAMFSLEVAAFLGIFTSILYAAIGYALAIWFRSSATVESDAAPADEPYIAPEHRVGRLVDRGRIGDAR